MSGSLRHFDGRTYDPAVDRRRLSGQYWRVFGLMRDGHWRTLEAIAAATGDPHASVSARLRDMRKPRNGGHRVLKRRNLLDQLEFRLEARHGGDSAEVGS